MSRRTLVVLTAVAVLVGCAPPTATHQVPASPGDDAADPGPARDCSRQFDDNDAGFQTCLEH
jgi:hypothetical protein